MDLQQLNELLATTYAADPNVRKAGELQLRKIAGQEGLMQALMQIIASEGIDPANRQAATVYLKNRITNKGYDGSTTA